MIPLKIINFNHMKRFISVVILTSFALISSSQIVEKELWQPYFIYPREVQSNQHISLEGIWKLSHTDKPIDFPEELKTNKKDPFDTEIPNSVQWSYFQAGKLPHPYVSLNYLQYKWITEKVWYYQKEIAIPESARGNKMILCFDGIDYFSRVWLNDTLIGIHEGMFGGPVIDISKLARIGQTNKITVEVKAGNWGNPNYDSRATGKIIKPWITAGGGAGRGIFFSMGMWKGARIEILPAYHIERPFITTNKVTADNASLHLSLEILAEITSLDKRLHPLNNTIMHHPGPSGKSFEKIDKNLEIQIDFISDDKVVESRSFKPLIYRGINWLEEDINIPDPLLWYPNGLGEPNLYKVNITLKKDDIPVDQITFNYGIRTIERQPTAGPRTADRWEDWHFIINGKEIFVKGMNWTPIDVLLDVSEERYRWVLGAAKNMGIQLIRVWGGGLIETDHFYNICDELGIMVWQDFPIGNQDTPDYPQDVWEAQVIQNIFRLRNHPALAVWCGGNEFNPYSYGNTASIGIIERNLAIFDNTRLFVRTSPDAGSMHTYPDMDPCWYNRSYKFEPYISETGMHSMPEANLFYELVNPDEFFDLGKMWDKSFSGAHPEFVHHFDEYSPGRVPRMVSRASHINDLSDPSIESITEASQVGTAEWYQIVSEKMQGNYPVTTGLMPWVFKRHWPAIAIQMMDWFGQAAAPYYFLKRTYEPLHIAVDLERLLWKSAESIDLKVKIINSSDAVPAATISVSIYDDKFNPLYNKKQSIDVTQGTSVSNHNFDSYTIPGDYKDRFLFIVTELIDKEGSLLSRSVYFPRVLSGMDDPDFYNKYIREPIAWITLEKGPWLKPTVNATLTSLNVEMISHEKREDGNYELKLNIENTGRIPAFMTKIDVEGAKRIFYASDNYFWINPGEEKTIDLTLKFREEIDNKKIALKVGAWNTKLKNINLNNKKF
jgi:beta-mannosidase